MPFKSEKQRRYCYYLKSQGRNGSWNCDEWSRETKGKLPLRVKKSKGAGQSYNRKTNVVRTPIRSPQSVKMSIRSPMRYSYNSPQIRSYRQPNTYYMRSNYKAPSYSYYRY